MCFKLVLVLCMCLAVANCESSHNRQRRQWGPGFRPRPIPKPSTTPKPQSSGPTTNGSVACGLQAVTFQPDLSNSDLNKVINGQESKPHSWPWIVTFLSTAYGQERNLCGGSLIRVKEGVEETDIVLTAGHCVARRETMQGTKPQAVSPSELTIAAGRHKYNVAESYDQKRKGQRIIMHPDFYLKGGYPYNDLAVVKLDRPIKFNDAIRPVCLPEQEAPIPTDVTCVAAGWGRNNSANYEASETLQQIIVPVHSAVTCSRPWPQQYKQESMICAGDFQGKYRVCNGDSGSTLMCKQNDRWVQHGAVSFGAGGTCLDASKPDVYARVAGFADWIKQSVQQMTSL